MKRPNLVAQLIVAGIALLMFGCSSGSSHNGSGQASQMQVNITAPYLAKINRALALLGPYSGYVNQWVKSVELGPCPAAWVVVSTREMCINASYLTRASEKVVAGIFVHEARHVEDFENNRPFNGVVGEASAVRKQVKFLKYIGAPLKHIGYLESQIGIYDGSQTY